MADNTQTAEQKAAAPKPSMPTGGEVMAIIPQSLSEIAQVANMVITAGIAPNSLVQKPKTNATDAEIMDIAKRNTNAVATAIMAGAELDLPPMASLRMLSVINGKPALYAEGNIAVIRKKRDIDGSKIAEYIKCGIEMRWEYKCPYCDKVRKNEEDVRKHIAHSHPDDDPTEHGIAILSDSTFGWCEAKRRDTGEIFREEFSIGDAKTAQLWDQRPEVQAEVWEWNEAKRKREPINKTIPNPAPWFRFWKRMLIWRPTGYCLRWLFADVLGGITDEYEARDIMPMIDITPPKADRLEPPMPPTTPADETGEEHNSENNSPKTAQQETQQDQPAAGEVDGSAPTTEESSTLFPDPPPVNVEAILTKLDEDLGFTTSIIEQNETWEEARLDEVLDNESMARAKIIRENHRKRFED